MDGTLEYGPFRLDRQTYTLARNGYEVDLEILPLRMFEFFIKHLNQRFSGDELMQEFWPDTQVTPSSVNTAIYKIRAILKPNDDLLEGKRGVGWRLMPWAEKDSRPPIESLPVEHRTNSEARENQEKSTDEIRFISIAEGAPSLHLGDLDIQSKLFPPNAWKQSPPKVYSDDLEDEHRVELVEVGSALPADLLSLLMMELEAKLNNPDTKRNGAIGDESEDETNMREIYKRLNEERSNSYPRLAGMPEVVPEGHKSTLRVPIAPSQYGVALIREKRIPLPTAQRLASEYILNSLAVRVALIYKAEDGCDWVEVHQRQAHKNATFSGAWDVSAAGYIDPLKHGDPSKPGRISPSQACADELSKELQIQRIKLPYRDNYYFFGVGRNDATGQVDLLGYCLGSFVPDPAREKSPFVACYDRCRLDPDSVATFVVEKRRWVPTALLTLMFALEAHGRYSRKDVEEAFQCCAGKLDLLP